MARDYKTENIEAIQNEERKRARNAALLSTFGTLAATASPLFANWNPGSLFALGAIPALGLFGVGNVLSQQYWLERQRQQESLKRGGKPVLGAPPQRDCFSIALEEAQAKGKKMLDKYLVGFELGNGKPLWVSDDDLCSHACVFAKTGVGKTLWLESLIFQQLARGRASGCTFIDAKRDSGTLAQVIMMCILTGRMEDLIVIDPFDPIHSYNFVMTNQRADVKARKVHRAGLPPTSDASSTKHYDRLASDSISRMVRAMETFGLTWTVQDIAVALSAFNLAYPHLRNMLHKIGARQAMVELGHLASSYRTAKGMLDTARITDNLRGVASEFHAIAGSEMGGIFCTQYTDLVLTDAIARGKIIYFMLPRLEEAESAARMVKIFREDLEVSIGEITSSRQVHLEDPHLVIIDEGSSTFGPTWANLFELARKGRFSLIFGAQSTGGLTDASMGLSEAFYERVMANVNLKIMMRIGDNRTAEDMAKWFGKVATTKKSVGAGVTTGVTSNVLRGSIDFRARQSGGESQSISYSEDEGDLVSSDELKHEMSAEKGLAWFDLGDGKIVKGRALWFNAEVPDSWEGREFVTRLERFENDEIGLGAWVDEQILSQEQAETSPRFAPKTPPKTDPATAQQSTANSQTGKVETAGDSKKEEEDSGPFRLGVSSGGPSMFRRGTVQSFPKKESPAKATEPKAQEKGEKSSPSSQSADKTKRNGSKNNKPRKKNKSKNKK